MLNSNEVIQKLKDLRILIVEDGCDIIKIMDNTFKTLAKEVYLTKDPIRGFELFEIHKPDIILTDLRMPRPKDGNYFIKFVRQRDTKVPIIVISAYMHDLIHKDLVNATMEKPIDFKKLIVMIDEVLSKSKEG